MDKLQDSFICEEHNCGVGHHSYEVGTQATIQPNEPFLSPYSGQCLEEGVVSVIGQNKERVISILKTMLWPHTNVSKDQTARKSFFEQQKQKDNGEFPSIPFCFMRQVSQKGCWFYLV